MTSRLRPVVGDGPVVSVSTGLDVIIRTHDASRLDELERAVFSAALQDYRPVTITVVCQRYPEAAVAAVRAAVAPILDIAGDVGFAVLNRVEAAPIDARAALLNLGFRAARGRYLAVLDYDDVIYPEGWRLLIGELEASGAAIAFGAVLNASVTREGVVPYVTDKRRVFRAEGLASLLAHNSCPVHSFVLDRGRIGEADLVVDEGMAALEDYELLLRIVSRYPASFHHRDTLVGEYVLKDDGSNINPLADGRGGVPREGVLREGGAAWLAALAEVNRRKGGMVLSPAVQAVLDVNEPGLTVDGFLAGVSGTAGVG